MGRQEAAATVGTGKGVQALRMTQEEIRPLAKNDSDEIDKLFKGYDQKPDSTPSEVIDGKGHRREQLKKGNDLVEKSKISAASRPEGKKATPVQEPKLENKIEKFRQIFI